MTEAMTRVHAVIPAAGHGARFGSSRNKLLANLGGKPIIERTVDAMIGKVDDVILVAGSEDLPYLTDLFLDKAVKIVQGADTRQKSVCLGLDAIEDDENGVVLVHDGARPFLSELLIERCIASCIRHGSGVAAVPVFDSLKRAATDDLISTTVAGDVSREGLWAVQTPQAFSIPLLRSAHRLASESGFVGSDEASLVQRLPHVEVHLVRGERRNIKITTADDLVFAESFLSSQGKPGMRVGTGYDIHRTIGGRVLWLGGVNIPSPFGLDGHSDADVLLHSLCDSLLGAAGLPDIGHLFPNTDPAYKGISSLLLLEQVNSELQRNGWKVGNTDSMLIAERPKIAPYIPEMRSKIASALGVEADCVSIKATTNEGVGSLGAGDGIACHSTAAIFKL